jgi:hypothetical protein
VYSRACLWPCMVNDINAKHYMIVQRIATLFAHQGDINIQCITCKNKYRFYITTAPKLLHSFASYLQTLAFWCMCWAFSSASSFLNPEWVCTRSYSDNLACENYLYITKEIDKS